jgi:mRNA interferase MazF
MAKFVKGDIVVIPFPFSNLSGSKRRPALVVADLPGEDILLCQITSQQSRDPYAITLSRSDFAVGSLPVDSYIRPLRLFTADKNIILSLAGKIKESKRMSVVRRIANLILEQE